MQLIDRDNDLISKSHFDERIREAVGMTVDELTEDFKDGIRTALELLKTEPTVDAVVRCKDCRHFRGGYGGDYCDCVIRDEYTPDWYCADGERKCDE